LHYFADNVDKMGDTRVDIAQTLTSLGNLGRTGVNGKLSLHSCSCRCTVNLRNSWIT